MPDTHYERRTSVLKKQPSILLGFSHDLDAKNEFFSTLLIESHLIYGEM